MADLREILDQSVPEPPPMDEWAERAETTARQRIRRRNGVLAATAGLAVLAGVGVPALSSLRGEPGTTTAGQAVPAAAPATAATGGHSTVSSPPAAAGGKAQQASASGGSPVTASAGIACPSDLTEVTAQPENLPAGATGFRWCSAEGYAPPELFADAGTLIEAYNAMEPAPGGGCSTAAPSWARGGTLGPWVGLLFQYPDGTTRLVSGHRSGCGVIGQRAGMFHVLSTARDVVQKERQAQGTPAATFTPCAFHSSEFTPELDEVTTAAACLPTGNRVHRLTDAQARALADDLSANPPSGQTDGLDPTESVQLQLYAPSGEFITLTGTRDGDWWLGTRGPWTPSPQNRALLDDIIKEK